MLWLLEISHCHGLLGVACEAQMAVTGSLKAVTVVNIL